MLILGCCQRFRSVFSVEKKLSSVRRPMGVSIPRREEGAAHEEHRRLVDERDD
jgi:hypothetical protein